MPDEVVRLSEVANCVAGDLRGDGSVKVNDVTHDSREAGPGSVFAAIRGTKVDGHTYVEGAAKRGAVAALVERFMPCPLPQVRVRDTRRALGVVAALVHGEPTSRLEVVGVTGTNGKTTVAVMLQSIARMSGRSVARVGTLGTDIDGEPRPLVLTTPEASDLQRLFATIEGKGVSLVALEVSSHALALNRVDGTCFAVAAFTNLSQDHLDFHGDMESYFAAKQRLFDGRASVHVIDVTTRWGRRLAEAALGPLLKVGYGRGHDVGISAVRPGLTSSGFVLHLAGRERAVTVRPGGRHNVHNAAVAAACARAIGIEPDSIVNGLQAVQRVSGRMDPVHAGQPFDVLVDYAHTPAAVETVVRVALENCSGSTIVVVGAAGDRDATKRPHLGAAASRAHLAVITSDNPRSEDPVGLVDQVAAGAVGGRAEVVREVDRSRAIRLAVERAEPGDAVLILGKGHEQYQQVGSDIVPFSDRALAFEYLRERWSPCGSDRRAMTGTTS